MSSSTTTPTGMRVRASEVLRVRRTWLLPVAVASVLIAAIAAIYIGSVVNPTGHLHALPVEIVNEDTGASVHGQKLDVGATVVSELERATGVTSRLELRNVTLKEARATMDRGGAYAALAIPATFSRSLVLATGQGGQGDGVPAKATVELLENSRLGSIGVNLAANVVASAIGAISPKIGTRLAPLATKSATANPINAADLADPVSLSTSTYRPLPDHSALGLSAFYIALLSIMSGFLGATLINSSVDSALGYGATEIGPRWRQRRPVAINRRQTLLIKMCAALVAAPVLTGMLMLVAIVALHMYAPEGALLWLLAAFAALMIATGTLALFAALGSFGQLLAMLLFVYLSLASSGGTIPIQALPGVFNVVGHVEPLRQVIDGTRAILYFGARGDAGLTHSLVVIGCELVFWLLVGLAVTSWYDKRGLYRIAPELFDSISRSIDRAVEEQRADHGAAGGGATAGTDAGDPVA